MRLGDLVLGRLGDKGANINLGSFVREPAAWDWFLKFMTCTKLQELTGYDWKYGCFIERVEVPHLYAVHFVIYGYLGRGVSSDIHVDVLGKSFAEQGGW